MQSDSSTTPLYVGIDIGKNVHCYGGYAGSELRLIQPRQEVRNNQSGYDSFRNWLQAQVAGQQYTPSWLAWNRPGSITRPGPTPSSRISPCGRFPLSESLPNATKAASVAEWRKKKTDPIDVEAIAYCLRDGQGNPPCLPEQQTLRFDLWAAEFRQAYREHQRLQLSILTQWTGFGQAC